MIDNNYNNDKYNNNNNSDNKKKHGKGTFNFTSLSIVKIYNYTPL